MTFQDFSTIFPVLTMIFQDTTINYFIGLIVFAGLRGHGSESGSVDKAKQINLVTTTEPFYIPEDQNNMLNW